MGEEWRDVTGYEGFYQVSNLGNVRSLDRVSGGRVLKGKQMKGKIVRNGGFRQVGLSRDGSCRPFYVHRLVADAFIPNLDDLPDVHHKNGDPLDNRADNLEWSEHETNAAKNWSVERAHAVIRGDGNWYPSATAAATELGVSTSAVVDAARSDGRRLCRGFSFRYEDDGSRTDMTFPKCAGKVYETDRAERFDGKKLKRLMVRKRVTVANLAELSGVSATSIYLYLSGSRLPSVKYARRIAAVLDTTLESLETD